MKKQLIVMGLLAGMLSGAASAQPPGGGQWGGPGNGQWGGGRMAGLRDNPKMRLNRLIRNIGALEEGQKATLTKAQAARIVAAINPWRKRATMSDANAQSLYTKIEAVLTSAQKTQMASMRPGRGNRNLGGPGGRDSRREGGPRGDRGEDRGRRGGWGGGSGGPGGPPSAQNLAQMQAFLKSYNPLYSPTSYKAVNALPERMRESMKRRYQDQQQILTALTRKAKG
jgi:hypothetical protein